jgi:mannan endo-1,4-beta-mannosidase
MIKIPVNKNAQKEVYEMLEYLSTIEGKGILTGQHTQTRAQEELQVIFKKQGNNLQSVDLNFYHIQQI